MKISFLVDDAAIESLRETLSRAQANIAGGAYYDKKNRDDYISRLQGLIDECDRHRPLGPDGKHIEHTETCGCEDKGHGTWCNHQHCGYSFMSIYGGTCTYCGHVYPAVRHVTGGLFT